MAQLKTTRTKHSVPAFIQSVRDPRVRADCRAILALMKRASGEKPAMWGTSIVGFGSYHYKSERSRQEGDWPLTGFSPRAQNLTVYIMPGFKKYATLLKKLGPHKKSVSCLYIKRLSDIHLPTLEKVVKDSVRVMKKRHRA
jgi:hypothetical protein